MALVNKLLRKENKKFKKLKWRADEAKVKANKYKMSCFIVLLVWSIRKNEVARNI